MTIQLVTDQLIDSIITEIKIANGSVGFAKLKTADVETTLTGSSSKIATAAAIKTYIDNQTPDSLSGGNGIDIDTSGDPDVVSVDLDGSAPGLEFAAAKLKVKVKSESGGSITLDGDGLYIANSAISNAKLATSTISGVALGANLNALSASNGLSMTSYNGSAAVADLTVVLDGATLAKSASGIKVADAGIGSSQLADNAVPLQKLGILPSTDHYTANGSTAAFTLQNRITASQLADFAMAVRVFRNGQRLKQVASSPSDTSEYTVADNGSATVVTLGGNPANGEFIIVDYWYDA